MDRAALQVGLGELKELVIELEKELKEQLKSPLSSQKAIDNIVCQINIVNKDGFKDSWELEASHTN